MGVILTLHSDISICSINGHSRSFKNIKIANPKTI